MKTFIKPLVYALAASLLLLACSSNPTAAITGDNPPTEGGGSIAKDQPQPYDPPMLLIANDVEKWMEEQLASKSSEKRLIMISDIYLPDVELSAELSATIDSDGKVEYFSNGNKISVGEYQSKWENERQRIKPGKRDLSIPGEIISPDDSYGFISYGWTVLMTAEQLAEVMKKYDKLAISFYSEPQTDDMPVN